MGICLWMRREKSWAFWSPIFPLNSQVIPQGKAQSLLPAPLHLQRNPFDTLPGPLLTVLPTQRWAGPHSCPTLPASPQRGSFIWKQRTDSPGPCHPAPQPDHSCDLWRQVTWMSGPALPPAPRGSLPLPVLSFPFSAIEGKGWPSAVRACGFYHTWFQA